KPSNNEKLNEFLAKRFSHDGKYITDEIIMEAKEPLRTILVQKKQYHDYLKSLFQKDLLNDDQINLFFSVFKRPLNTASLEDAKAIKNIVKFSKQISKVTKSLNADRTNKVLQYSNELFDIYKYQRYKG